MKLKIDIPKYQVSISNRERLNPQYLKLRRILGGVTLSAVAKEAKVSKQFLSAVENGRKSCPEYIEKIYEAMKLRSGIAF